MIPNPIRKALSSIRMSGVKYLLMGGQACILYGAAEFSRDLDLIVFADPDNLGRLEVALGELQAEIIAVPPLTPEFLERGHAVHFRCQNQDVKGLRLDIMSKLRNTAEFEALWSRRTTVEVSPGENIEVISLPDLVTAKKTQRDKDWPMIRRLLEAHYFLHRHHSTSEQVVFWLNELLTPELLLEIPDRPTFHHLVKPARQWTCEADLNPIIARQNLQMEEETERAEDREYWQPLKAELEKLRRVRGASRPIQEP